MKFKEILLLITLCFPVIYACSEDEPQIPDNKITEVDMAQEEEEEAPVEEELDVNVAGTVEFFDKELTYDGYILINDAGGNDDRVYIMDKNANIIKKWELTRRIGNDVILLPNGKLLGVLQVDEPAITFGGKGGKLQFINSDSTVEWDYTYSSEDYIIHHDAELLPNGNVITIVWERKIMEEAELAGSKLDMDIFPEAIIEVNPSTDEIVWEWHAWDHLIQDFSDTRENFGSVADNPQLIDLNYAADMGENMEGDIMHANGISYDEKNDLIYLSVNFYHEVWVIDHSVTTEEAATHTGGTQNKGGDLIYRFGNPKAYRNTKGKRLFRNNHYPNLLKNEDEGKMLIFTNGAELEQSTAYELQLPATLSLAQNTDNEPTVVWSFTDPELYAPKVSGVVKLPNGNRMITEGDFGIWEVTEAGEVVWKFSGDGFFWRAYHYDKNAPEILSLGL